MFDVRQSRKQAPSSKQAQSSKRASNKADSFLPVVSIAGLKGCTASRDWLVYSVLEQRWLGMRLRPIHQTLAALALEALQTTVELCFDLPV